MGHVVMGQITDGSDWSRVTKYDPLTALDVLRTTWDFFPGAQKQLWWHFAVPEATDESQKWREIEHKSCSGSFGLSRTPCGRFFCVVDFDHFFIRTLTTAKPTVISVTVVDDCRTSAFFTWKNLQNFKRDLATFQIVFACADSKEGLLGRVRHLNTDSPV